MSEEQVVVTDVVEVAPEILAEARQQGWVPKEEFRGPEEQWTDAETFVQRGREINPILRKHNQELKKQLDKLRQEAEEVRETAREFREFQKEQYEQKQRLYEQEIARLKAAKRDAITSGDGETVVAIDDRIDQLKEEKSSLKEPTEPKKEEALPQVDDTLQSWIDRNPWYGKDTDDGIEYTEITNSLATSLRRRYPNLVGEEFLAKLDERIAERLPDLKKAKQKPNSPVEGNTHTTRSKGAKNSYESLPADVKATCDRFIKQGMYGKLSVEEARKAYADEYFTE